MKTDGATSETLLVRCVLFAYVLCPSASGTEPLIMSLIAMVKHVIFRNKINFYTKIQTHFLFLAILAAGAAVYSDGLKI